MIFIIGRIHRSYLRAVPSVRCICAAGNEYCINSNVFTSSRHVSQYQHNIYRYKLDSRYYSQSLGQSNKTESPPPEKLGIVARFKQMYRDYWYVLLPVHIVTSTVWFGSFYFLAKGGVDIIQLMTWMGFSESLIEPLRNSSAGYFAIAYALYKIATPLRYTVTIGGTTLSINYLRNRGYIKPKPIPSADKLKEMYQDTRQEFLEKTNQMREKKENIKDIKLFQSKVRDFKGGSSKLK